MSGRLSQQQIEMLSLPRMTFRAMTAGLLSSTLRSSAIERTRSRFRPIIISSLCRPTCAAGLRFIDIVDGDAFSAVFHLTVAQRCAGMMRIGAGGRQVLLSRVTSTSSGFPSRSRPSFTLVPGSVVAIREQLGKAAQRFTVHADNHVVRT